MYIESLGEDFGPNQLFRAEYIHDTFIRVTTLNYILSSKNLDKQFFGCLVDCLINRDRIICINNIRQQTNSQVHRERLRLLQTILVILPRLTENDYAKVLKRCDEILLGENQPSLRTLTEWIYVRVMAFGIEKIELDFLWAKVDAFTFYRV